MVKSGPPETYIVILIRNGVVGFVDKTNEGTSRRFGEPRYEAGVITLQSAELSTIKIR